MLDSQSASTLAEVVRREGRSLLSYMTDAYPWASAKKEPALEAVLAAATASQEAMIALGTYLVQQRMTPPVLGSYPPNFTSYNFVGLKWLLPRLVASEKASLALLEADTTRVASNGAKQQLTALADVKRQTLAQLEGLG